MSSSWAERLGITGRRIGSPAEQSLFRAIGRPATEDAIRACRSLWPQVEPEDLQWEGEPALYRVAATGALFRRVSWDPLAVQQPGETSVALFMLDKEEPQSLIFYERAHEESVEAVAERELERERAAAERRAALAAEEQSAVLVGDDRGQPCELTVRAAWQQIDAAGGQVRLGEFGEIQITLPATTPRLERTAAAAAAQVLVSAAPVVTAWIRDARSLATLPERRPTVGGGVE